MIRTFDPMSDFSIETHAVSTFSKDICLINLVPRVHSLALKPCGPGKEVVCTVALMSYLVNMSSDVM